MRSIIDWNSKKAGMYADDTLRLVFHSILTAFHAMLGRRR